MNTDHFNNEHHEAPSQYEVTVLELHGGHTPRFGLDQEDLRPIPSEDMLASAASGFMEVGEMLAMGTVLEVDYIEMISSIITGLHYQLGRLEKAQEDTGMEVQRLNREFDGSEIKDHQLQQQTNLMRQIEGRANALEGLRDALAANLHVQHGFQWNPPGRGGRHSKRSPITQAVLDSKDVLAAQREQKHIALNPEGSRVAFTGGKDYKDVDKIWKTLDRVRERHPDMVLVHGAMNQGAELIARKWAENRGVSEIHCTPDWKTYNKAAPFKRNEEMIKHDLVGLIAVPGSGITDNLIDRARGRNIPVMKVDFEVA
jgi:hypothetical protein